MRRYAVGQRRKPALAQALVRARDRTAKDALSDVLAIRLATDTRREHEVARLGELRARLVRRELLDQARADLDLAYACLGLRVARVDARMGEIDVAPSQLDQLADAKSGEDERRKCGSAPDRLPDVGVFTVELAGCIEERDDSGRARGTFACASAASLGAGGRERHSP